MEWWVCGPISWGGPVYEDVLATLSRVPMVLGRMRVSRHLIVVECREGNEVGLNPPKRPELVEEETTCDAETLKPYPEDCEPVFQFDVGYATRRGI